MILVYTNLLGHQIFADRYAGTSRLFLIPFNIVEFENNISSFRFGSNEWNYNPINVKLIIRKSCIELMEERCLIVNNEYQCSAIDRDIDSFSFVVNIRCYRDR